MLQVSSVSCVDDGIYSALCFDTVLPQIYVKSMLIHKQSVLYNIDLSILPLSYYNTI